MDNAQYGMICGWRDSLRMNMGIPAVYGDELSFYDTLAKLLDIVCQIANEQQDWVNWETLNPILDKIRASVEAEAKAREAGDAELASRIDFEHEWTEAAIEKLAADVRALVVELIAQAEARIESYLDWQLKAQAEQLQRQIDELEMELDKLSKTCLLAFDPTAGFWRDVSTVVNRVYSFARIRAFTAARFDAMGTTAASFDVKIDSAYEFDCLARNKLDREFDRGMPSPLTGLWTDWFDLIGQLFDYHRSDWNAADFDSQGYTPTSYDALAWSAEYHDFKNYVAT